MKDSARRIREDSADFKTFQEQESLPVDLIGKISFSPSLPVSVSSNYGDSIWSWENHVNGRLNSYAVEERVIDWEILRTDWNLTTKLIEELKRYSFLRITDSVAVFSKTKKNAHPVKLLREVKSFVKFLAHIRSKFSAGDQSLINSLCDIKFQDIKISVKDYSFDKSLLIVVLCNLGSEFFGLFSGIDLQWNSQDILTITTRKIRSFGFDKLPEKLFSQISNEATIDVKQFLKALDMNVQDTSPLGEKGNKFTESFPDFKEVFEDYVKFRALMRNSRRGQIDYIHWTQKIANKRHSVRHLSGLVDRARKAAQMIIMLYTGARISEFAGFRLGCVRRKDDYWIIVGTVIKRKNIFAPTEKDEWVAIPIVRDAVNLLEQTARITDAKYLFHDSHYQPLDDERQMTSCEVSYRIRCYIDLIDEDNEWESFEPHSHQFRNSLVYEMRKAGLGLPFITHQLKHSYNTLDYSINNVSLGYGSIGSNAVQGAIDAANKVAISELYHPDVSVTGKGATKFKERRMAYFQGIVIQGFDVEDVLHLLAKEGGMPLTDVGLGYCQGQTKILVDGVESDPPCIGQLRCSPVRCSNAVIPSHKRPIWEKAAEVNLVRAEDPYFAHARNVLLQAAEEAKSVVEFFQIEGEINGE